MSTSGKLFNHHSAVDLAQIIELDKLHFPNPWSEENWKVLPPEHHLIYTWKDIGVNAFALFHRIGVDPTAHLLKICVEPNLRQSGLSLKFWEEISQELKSLEVKSVYLEVEKSNISAVKFYGKLGFQLYREISGFYSNGATALTMGLTL